MITSMASQYLQPDYLQPLPTTLDAKKSPLALLAQTCSSIGKDSGSAKSIIPPIEKKDKDKDKSDSPNSKSGSSDDKGRTSSSGSDKRDGTPGSARGDSPKGSFRAPAPKDIPPLVPISSSSDKTSPATSSSERTSPKASISSSSDRDRESTSVTNVLQHSVAATSTTSVGAHSNSRISLSCGNMLLEVNHHESAAKALGLSGHPSLHGGPHKAEGLATPNALHAASLGAYSSLPFFGHPIPMDLASSMYSSLPGHNIGGLGGSVPKTGMSPYVSYARVKTTSGATTLVPVCKDPYCTHCQMTMQGAQLSSSQCGAGCTQCTHDKSYAIPTSLSAHSVLGGMPLLPSSAASLSLSSLYPHTLGMLPGHSGLPYVCNWVGGSEYCGKRFPTSDELLQHLRTHTSSSDAAAALAHAGLSHSALGLAGCHSHYPPGSLSPTALRQSYPRSLSPNTLLAASRFHPYKSPLSSLPTPGSGLTAAGLQSLGAYYSPYSLYGQRMGAVAP